MGNNLSAQLFVGLNEESEAAWKKPLVQLSDRDLYILLSQRASLGRDAAHLLPLAVERIEKDPLAVAHSLPGDMHTPLAMLDPDLWSGQPDIASRWAASLKATFVRRGSLAGHDREIWEAMLEMAQIRHPFVAAAFNRAKKSALMPTKRKQSRKKPSTAGKNAEQSTAEKRSPSSQDLVNKAKRLAKQAMKAIDEMTRKSKGKK